MIARIGSVLSGDRLRARALRGTALTFVGFGGGQALRLASNLVLTRILFPEAFGLMALVQIFLVGLQMFSDTGIATSIMQNKRGDEPAFLDTAWTVQVGRGVLLWLMAVLAAGPLAEFYDQPMLAQLLPVAGLGAILMGLQSTKLATANRNLTLARVIWLDLGTQAFGIAATVVLAIVTQSVWALLLGGLLGNAIKTVLSHTAMPGHGNRIRWDHSAFSELFNFGKYIFLASIAGFLVNNADRAILGKFIAIGDLGIYNIGYFLASVPLMLSQQFANRILIPIYAKAGDGPADRRNVRLARLGLTGGLTVLGLGFAFTGVWLVDFLYEAQYALAGPILVLLSLSYLPGLLTIAYSSLLLGQGRSGEFTLLVTGLAVVQTAALVVGVGQLGLMGAIAAPAVTAVVTYPFTAWLAWRRGGWDPVLDLGFAGVFVLGIAAALWINPGAVAAVLGG